MDKRGEKGRSGRRAEGGSGAAGKPLATPDAARTQGAQKRPTSLHGRLNARTAVSGAVAALAPSSEKTPTTKRKRTKAQQELEEPSFRQDELEQLESEESETEDELDEDFREEEWEDDDDDWPEPGSKRTRKGTRAASTQLSMPLQPAASGNGNAAQSPPAPQPEPGSKRTRKGTRAASTQLSMPLQPAASGNAAQSPPAPRSKGKEPCTEAQAASATTFRPAVLHKAGVSARQRPSLKTVIVYPPLHAPHAPLTTVCFVCMAAQNADRCSPRDAS